MEKTTHIDFNNLIRSKFSPPRQAPNCVQRKKFEQAYAYLNELPITTVVAASGYGKTTLLCQWYSELIRQNMSVAWLTLDNKDDDPIAFFVYLAGAIANAFPSLKLDDILVFMASPSAGQDWAAIPFLVNALETLDKPLHIFLDDFHHLQSLKTLSVFSNFVRYAPSGIRFVIASRVSIPLPLNELKSHGHIQEIKTPDLAFEISETMEFLSEQTQSKMRLSEMASLHHLVDGWPVGLQLASYEMKGKNVAWKIENTESQSGILSRFLSQTIDGLDPQTRLHLETLSVVEKFCPSLATELTGLKNPEDFLNNYIRELPLIIQLDDEGEWYRFHQLLSDHLQKQLLLRRSDELMRINAKAYHWLTKEGLHREATSHALASGKSQEALNLIKLHGDELFVHGQLYLLLTWIDLLPQDLVKADFELQLLIAWLHVISRNLTESFSTLACLEKLLAANQEQEGYAGRKLNVGLIQATLGSMSGNYENVQEGSIAYMEADIMDTSFSHSWRLAVARNVYSMTQSVHRNWIEAEHIISEDMGLLRGDYGPFTQIYSLCVLAFGRERRGLIHDSARLYEQSLAIADALCGAVSQPRAVVSGFMARSLYMTEKWDELRTIKAPVEGLIWDCAPLIVVANWGEAIVKLNIAQKNPAQAEKCLGRLQSIANVYGKGYPAAMGQYLDLYIRLSKNDFGAATHILLKIQSVQFEDANLTGVNLDIYTREHLTLALGRLCLGAAREAADITNLVIEACLNTELWAAILEAKIIQACAYWGLGMQDKAFTAFTDALKIAQPANYMRPFKDMELLCSHMRKIIANYLKKYPLNSAEYSFVKSFIVENEHNNGNHKTVKDIDEAAELTAREIQILSLVSDGMTNKDIAQSLSIGRETVKWYMKQIFSKLSVSNRMQAVNKFKLSSP